MGPLALRPICALGQIKAASSAAAAHIPPPGQQLPVGGVRAACRHSEVQRSVGS